MTKYYLSECIEPDGTLWVIEKHAPNSGKLVFETKNKEIAFKKIEKLNFHSKLYCFFMNIIDFRFWFCGCGYFSPYGLVIEVTCKKH